MPELPEVETVMRGLAPRLEGRRISKFAQRVEGRRVRRLERRAKYMLWRLDGGETIVVHLGMSGRMVLVPAREANTKPFDTHDHVVFETDDGWQIRFNDARRFGLVLLIADTEIDGHKLFTGLGPEPLDAAFDGRALAARLKGKRTPIKAALLDQRVLVGVGNIYACEALYHAGISPRRLAHTVKADRAVKLMSAIKDVLNRSIHDGGSTLRDHVQPDGELGYFQTRFSVYDKEGATCPTPDCGRPVKRIIQSGRSTFYCARCQR
jgi:formamidopyrimidine-DNA glycosylase